MNIYHSALRTLLVIPGVIGIIVASELSVMGELATTVAQVPQTEIQNNHSQPLDQIITTKPNQTFDELMQEANAAAQTLVEQQFTNDRDDVAIRILAEHGGQIAPLLLVEVTRQQWQTYPSVERWATSLGQSSRVLLGFIKLQNQSTSKPPAVSQAPRSIRRGRGKRTRLRQARERQDERQSESYPQ